MSFAKGRSPMRLPFQWFEIFALILTAGILAFAEWTAPARRVDWTRRLWGDVAALAWGVGCFSLMPLSLFLSASLVGACLCIRFMSQGLGRLALCGLRALLGSSTVASSALLENAPSASLGGGTDLVVLPFVTARRTHSSTSSFTGLSDCSFS